MNTNQINAVLIKLENDNRAHALRELSDLQHSVKTQKYSNVPTYAMSRTKFEDKTTNGLTTCVLRWLQLNEHYCSRIQSQGQYNQTLGRFIKSTVRRGIGDIMAVIAGRTIMIEIKTGRDKLSLDQIKTRQEVENSGGVYLEVRDFATFLKWYRNHTELTGSSPNKTNENG
jgi:hypothetical protein